MKLPEFLRNLFMFEFKHTIWIVETIDCQSQCFDILSFYSHFLPVIEDMHLPLLTQHTTLTIPQL